MHLQHLFSLLSCGLLFLLGYFEAEIFHCLVQLDRDTGGHSRHQQSYNEAKCEPKLLLHHYKIIILKF